VQKHGGRTEQCWDEKSVGAEWLVEVLEIVGEAAPLERRADQVSVEHTG
jgi:hypothetical protein